MTIRDVYDEYMDAHIGEYGNDGVSDFVKALENMLPEAAYEPTMTMLFNLIDELEFNSFQFGISAAHEGNIEEAQ